MNLLLMLIEVIIGTALFVFILGLVTYYIAKKYYPYTFHQSELQYMFIKSMLKNRKALSKITEKEKEVK